MGQCLVTKLKGVVNNDTLKKLGCIQFKKNTDGDCVLNITGNGEDITVVCSDSRSFLADSISVNTYTIHDEYLHQFSFSDNGYNIEIHNKYNIVNVEGSGACYMMDISDLNYCNHLTSWVFRSPSYANGSLDNLIDNDSIITFAFPVPGGLTGHVESLSKFKNLASLTLNDNANIIGDWCTLVRQIYAKGRTSGSITISWIGSMYNVKFNGVPVANAASGNLAWSSETGKITLTVGTSDSYEADLVV